jgi:lipopolysaccharide export system permease protein
VARVFLLTTKKDTESVTTAHSGHIENSAQGRTLVLDVGHRNEHDAKSNENNRMQFERFRLLVDDRPAPNTSALPPRPSTPWACCATPPPPTWAS